MTTSTHATSWTRRHPLRQILHLLPAGMAIMVAVDLRLGERAEYFHAAELLGAWGDLITGRGLGHRSFVAGQDRMSDVAALEMGTALFVLEPLVAVAVLVGAAHAVAGLRRRVRTG